MTPIKTTQMDEWTGDFGAAYTDRSTYANEADFNQLYVKRYGRTRDDISRDWLGDLPAEARILEVGSNVGHQLRSLQRAGFQNLFGIEIQRSCVDKAKKLTPGVDIIEGSAFDIPFKDGFFDLVFTNNVLIHFAPDDLGLVLDEMYRVTRGYIWGFEYFAPEVQSVEYRSNRNLLWKADYSRIILKRFSDLRSCREETYECLDEPQNTDKAYLLKKVG